MKVPVGFIATLWSFIYFLPFFFLLLVLGLLKGAHQTIVICPIVIGIVVLGNSAVIIGLWPAHFTWTCNCVLKTKRLGLVLKILVLLLLPVPLILWPIAGIVGSFLEGIGYGFFAPFLSTFEAVGQTVSNKLYNCFCCLLVTLLGVPVDVPLITAVALWKSPFMLLKGWKRLLEDLIGREGPFLETVCVPFAGLAIILWPLAVVGAVISAFISSFFLALYAGVIVHQIRSKFCLPSICWSLRQDNKTLTARPRYCKNMKATDGLERRKSIESSRGDKKEWKRCLVQFKTGFRGIKDIEVRDWLFKSWVVNGRILIREGLIDVKDIEEYILKGKCKKLGIKLPVWCILQCLLASVKSNSSGLVVSDEVELTMNNLPKDKVFEWFFGPLLIMKEQIKGLRLNENEEDCMRKLIMRCKNDKPEEWVGSAFPSSNTVRRAQLQAIIRRV